jgi:hypothetical protein
VLARIERLNPQLNAVPHGHRGQALRAARGHAEIAAGKYRGVLHGIPIAHKDLFDTKGVRTTAGMKIFVDRVPDADAAVVEKLRDARRDLARQARHARGGVRHDVGQHPLRRDPQSVDIARVRRLLGGPARDGGWLAFATPAATPAAASAARPHFAARSD